MFALRSSVIVIAEAPMSQVPAAKGGAGLKGVEADILHGELEVELLGDRIEEVDIEPGVAGAVVSSLEFERRVGDVRAHGERSGLYETVLVVGGGSVTAARVRRSGGAAGEREGGRRHEGETGDEVATRHVGSCESRARRPADG